MIFKSGAMVDSVIGAVDKGTLKRMIDNHV
jgi:hypothetical protein